MHASCILGTTVMNGGPCNDPTPPPEDQPLGPTGEDTSASNNSTYKTPQNRNVCGW
jgi:hypothetical protein